MWICVFVFIFVQLCICIHICLFVHWWHSNWHCFTIMCLYWSRKKPHIFFSQKHLKLWWLNIDCTFHAWDWRGKRKDAKEWKALEEQGKKIWVYTKWKNSGILALCVGLAVATQSGKTLDMATFQFVWNLHWKHWKLWKHWKHWKHWKLWKHRHLALLNSNWSLFFPVRCRKECTVPNKEEECTVLNKEEECTVLNSKCSADAIDQSPPDHNTLETDAIYCSNKDCTVDIAL